MNNCTPCGNNTLPATQPQEQTCNNIEAGTYEICYFDCVANRERFGTSVVSSGGSVKFYDELGELITNQVKATTCPECEDLCISKYLANNDVVKSTDGSIGVEKTLNDNGSISYDLKASEDKKVALVSGDNSVDISTTTAIDGRITYDLSVTHPDPGGIAVDANGNVTITIDGDTHTINKDDDNVVLNADGSITITLEDDQGNVTVQTVHPPSVMSVAPNGDATITIGGVTHTFTAAQVVADDDNIVKNADGSFTIKLQDEQGNTTIETIPAPVASADKFVTGYEFFNETASYPNGIDSIRRTNFNDVSFIDTNESYLLTKNIPDLSLLDVTKKELVDADAGTTHQTITIPAGTFVGKRPTDNGVLVKMKCRASVGRANIVPDISKDSRVIGELWGAVGNTMVRFVNGSATTGGQDNLNNQQKTEPAEVFLPFEADGSVTFDLKIHPLTGRLDGGYTVPAQTSLQWEAIAYGYERRVF